MAEDLTKRAYDERILQVNLGPVMRSNDSIRDIISVTADSPITITNITNTTGVVSFLAAGGEVGESYQITIRFTTASTPLQQIEAVVNLNIIDEC